MISDTNQKSYKSPQIPLKLVLVVPFVLQIAGAVGLVGYLSYRSGKESVNQLTTEIRTQTTNNVVQYLNNYLATPVLINRINADAFRLGYLKINNTSQLEQYLYTQLQQFSTVSHILVGTEEGVFRVANRNPSPSILMSDPLKPSQIYVYHVDKNGKKNGLIQTLEQFNLKSRPWYQTAVKAAKPLRVPIFQLADNSDLSFNSSYPIYEPKTGKLLGVFSAASDLNFLRKFMVSLQIGKTGRVFVVERNGLLIGTSTNQLPYSKKQNNGEIYLEQIKATESKDSLIQATSRYVLNKFGSFEGIKKPLQLDFLKDNNQERQFVQIVPYKDDLGLDWLIIVVVPESDFTGAIKANNNQTILLCLLTFLTATGIGLITANWISYPIFQLNQSSQSLAKGELNQFLSENQMITKIRTLSTFFNVMSEQIHQSFNRVEIALEESREKYKTVFEILPIGILITDAKGQLIEGNPILGNILGISPQEYTEHLQDENFWQIIRSDGSPMPPEEFASVRALKENCFIHNVEKGIVQTDGTIHWLSVSAAPIPLANYGIAITYIDINDRKQAELALQASETRFQKIAISSPGGIYILVHRLDKSTYFEYLSSFFEDICEISIEQLLNNFYLYKGLIHPDDLVGYQEAVTDSMKNLSPFQHEWRIITPSKKVKWLQARSRPECREDGDVAWYGVMVDITTRKETEIALATAKEAAEAATKAKSQFLANMSHEIRTPMNGVLGMAQLLSNTSLNDEQRDIVQTIRDSGDALLVIINDILDFSKIESGMLKLEQRSFVLKNIITSVCNLMQEQVYMKGISLKYSIAPDVPVNILGDSSRLRQILLNLVVNAIKFTNNGSINISVFNRKTEKESLELIFTIQDTGIGINSDRLKKLFQPFTQADASINRQYGGTGLGLAISKSLVTLMGGTIWVESCGNIGGIPPNNWILDVEKSQNQGSIFYFTLMTKENLDYFHGDVIVKNPQQAVAIDKCQIKILLAEDNKVNQKVAMLTLKRLGYHADVANNGVEVLSILEKKFYDVILMDMQMPEMDGLTATKIIRQTHKTQPYIIALTANALAADRQLCLEIGMNDFLSKPIAISEITRALSEYLQTHSDNSLQT